VAEIQFCDYIFNTIDLLKIAGNTLWVTNGLVNLPMVVMTPSGAGIFGSVYHSHSFDAWATRLPGWKIVMPSTPIDAYGLMLSAIEDPNPVLFLKPKALLRVRGEELIPGEPEDPKVLRSLIDQPVTDEKHTWKPKWPKLEKYLVPLGKGKVTRVGDAATVVSYGRTLHVCHEAVDDLAHEGVQVEVIDMRTLYPYDWPLIVQSIKKTRRVLFVNEDTEVTNFGEHLAYRTTQELFYELLARPRVLAGKNVPGIGLHPNLEKNTVPQKQDVLREIKDLLSEVP